jgi:pimeloyl-ACP methyl ester carboxylesterase
MTSQPNGIRAVETRGTGATVWEHWGVEPAERSIEVGSPPSRIGIQEVGSGEPVLFVHGTGGYGPYWAPLVAELKDYRCLMLDRPGWGGSDRIDYSRAGYRDLVADLMLEILDKLGVDKAHLVGASIGDTWALALASKYPRKVHSVTLLGGGPLTRDVKIPPGIKFLRSPLGRLMSRVRWREKMETGQARQSGHGPALDDGRMPQIYVDWKVSMTNDTDWRANEREMVRAITGRRDWKPGLTFHADDLASISVPVLMIYGTDDPIANAETWNRFIAEIPEGRLELVEAAGHLPWFDDPGQVSTLLRDHLQTATS